MVPFFPVLGWQEAVLELRTAWDWRGCAVREGAETSEHLHLVTLAKFCSPGLFFLGKTGDFPLFSPGVLGNFSCHFCVRCRKRILGRPGSALLGSKASSAP